MSGAPRVRYRHAAAVVGSRIFLFGGRDSLDYLVPQVGLGWAWGVISFFTLFRWDAVGQTSAPLQT